MENNKILSGNCWVAYFDFVGFKNLIKEFTDLNGEGNLGVFHQCYYADIVRIAKKVISEVEKTYKVFGKIGSFYFSDTFIFFAPEDKQPGSYVLYNSIDDILRHFFINSLYECFFFRGALSFGDFYANIKEGVFLGPALIDAYEYTGKQDWFGVVLTPKVIEKLKGTDLDIDRRADYANYTVPVKKIVDDSDSVLKIKRETQTLYSYRISKYNYVEEMIVQKQTETKIKNPNDYEAKYKPKYEEVLKFLKETKLKSISS